MKGGAEGELLVALYDCVEHRVNEIGKERAIGKAV